MRSLPFLLELGATEHLIPFRLAHTAESSTFFTPAGAKISDIESAINHTG